MTDSEGMRGIAETLCDLGEPRRDLVAARTLDAVGAMALGVRSAEGNLLRTLLEDLNTAPAGVSPWSGGVLDKLLHRVAATRLTELDDIHMPSCVTAGAVVIPTAVTIGSALGASPEDYLRMVTVGYEAITRVGRAIDGATVVYSGVWPTLYVASVGAAAVTACALDLSPRSTASALGLALSSASGTTGDHEARWPGRWLSVGNAARAGCLFAFAAARGVDGDLTAERMRSLLRSPTALTQESPELAIEAMSVKPFPCAKQVLAGVEAALSLGDAIAVDDVIGIRLHVPSLSQAMVARAASEVRLSRLSSASWNIALALCCPERLDDFQRRHSLTRPALHISEIVEVHGAEDLSEQYPGRWGARLEIQTKTDELVRVVVDSVGDPPGDQASLLEEKWDRLLGDEAQRWRSICREAVGEAGGLSRLDSALTHALT